MSQIPPENRFGGYGVTVALDKVEGAREEYHNVHTSFPDFKLPRKMEYEQDCTLLDIQFMILQMVNR